MVDDINVNTVNIEKLIEEEPIKNNEELISNKLIKMQYSVYSNKFINVIVEDDAIKFKFIAKDIMQILELFCEIQESPFECINYASYESVLKGPNFNRLFSLEKYINSKSLDENAPPVRLTFANFFENSELDESADLKKKMVFLRFNNILDIENIKHSTQYTILYFMMF